MCGVAGRPRRAGASRPRPASRRRCRRTSANFAPRGAGCGSRCTRHGAPPARCAVPPKSDPHRLFGVVQSTKPTSLKLPPISCTSVPPPWSSVVIGMRRGRANSVSMLGTCVVLLSADLRRVRVALVAGLLERRRAALLRRQDAVGALARQAARALHRVGVVAVEAGRAPDRHRRRELALGGGRGGVGFVGDQRVRMRGVRPRARCQVLVVAGHADDVVGLVEAGCARRGFLEALAAQELLVALGGSVSKRCGSWQVPHCTCPAFAAPVGSSGKRGLTPGSRTPITRPAAGGKPLVDVEHAQFAVARRELRGVGDGDRVVVAQVDAEAAA